METVIFIVVIILLIYFCSGWKYSIWNTTNVNGFNVHNEYEDKTTAAETLAEIKKRTETLIDHLQSKYGTNYDAEVDYSRGGRLDRLNFTDLYRHPQQGGNTEYISDRVTDLATNFNPDDIWEISPLNSGGYTSYAEGKSRLVFCLRQKEPNATGEHPIHDINTLTFVTLHELTHLANDKYGHEDEFWRLFKFILQNAVEAGIYVPQDFKKNPVMYCGLKLTYNPLNDKTL